MTTSVVVHGATGIARKEAEMPTASPIQGVDVLTMHVDSPKVIIETAGEARHLRLRLSRRPVQHNAEGIPDGAGMESGARSIQDYVMASGSRPVQELPALAQRASKKASSGRCRHHRCPTHPNAAKAKALTTAKAKLSPSGTSWLSATEPDQDNTGKVGDPGQSAPSRPRPTSDLRRNELSRRGVVGKIPS